MQHPRSDELHGARRIATGSPWHIPIGTRDTPKATCRGTPASPTSTWSKRSRAAQRSSRAARWRLAAAPAPTRCGWRRGASTCSPSISGAARHPKGARKGGPRRAQLPLRGARLSRRQARRAGRSTSYSIAAPFTVFDDAEVRAQLRRARPRAAGCPDGQWLSLIGSTDGRAARHRAAATQRARGAWPSIEPLLELLARSCAPDYFETMIEGPAAMAVDLPVTPPRRRRCADRLCGGSARTKHQILVERSAVRRLAGGENLSWCDDVCGRSARSGVLVSYVVVARGLRGGRVFADKNMTAVPGVFGVANGRGVLPTSSPPNPRRPRSGLVS